MIIKGESYILVTKEEGEALGRVGRFALSKGRTREE